MDLLSDLLNFVFGIVVEGLVGLDGEAEGVVAEGLHFGLRV